MNLVAWAGDQDVLYDRLTEWEDVGLRWQNGESEAPINDSIRLQTCSHARHKRERWVRNSDVLSKDI